MTETTPPSTDARPAPVVPKPAASLLVLRMGAISRKAEVLMGMRGAKHKFMPNRLVFPGGRVDPEDHGVAPASEMPASRMTASLGGRRNARARSRRLDRASSDCSSSSRLVGGALFFEV